MHRGPDPPLAYHLIMLTGRSPDVGLQGTGAAAPKEKFGSPRDSEEEADNDVIATASSEGDSEDGDPEVLSSLIQSLANQIHVLTALFDAYWDESQEHRVALSQDMDALKAEMAIIRSNQDRIMQ